MQDSTRSSAAARERARAGGSTVSAKRPPRRRWSTEEKARVVRESLRPGKRVGEVARRYGISRWQLSTWRSLARRICCSCAYIAPMSASASATASGSESFARSKVRRVWLQLATG